MALGSGHSLAGTFGPGAQKVVVRYYTELQLFQGLTEAGESASWFPFVGAGKATFCYMILYIACLSIFMIWKQRVRKSP